MTEHAGLVRRSLAAETAEELHRRVEAQAGRLTDAIDRGDFDNEAFTVGLELEVYAVAGAGVGASDGGTAGTGGPDADGPLRLAAVPEAVFEGPATKELGLHNAEINAEPTAFDGDGIVAQAESVAADLAATRERAREHGLDVVLDAMWAVPPAGGTVDYLDDVRVEGGDGPAAADAADRPGDADGEGDPPIPGPDPEDPVVVAQNMRGDPRYVAIDNDALRRAGGTIPFEVPGASLSFRSILFESLATSIQPHVQVPAAADFPRYHNLAVRTLGPLLALSTNSPFLPADCYGDADPGAVVDGTHHELRVAAFEQSVNQGCRKVRVPEDLAAATDVVDAVVADETYAPFLSEWLADDGEGDDRESVPPGGDDEGDAERDGGTELGPAGAVDATDCWEFDYKRGTFWRWVRGVVHGDPVDGACDERSIRLEHRPLPTQPTVRDVVGLQVLTAGLLRGLVAADHPLEDLPWAAAERSFYAAVEDGLDADLAWVTADGERTGDPGVVFDEVFAYARRGLDEQGVPGEVQDRYLGPIEARWDRGVTPSVWKKRRVREALDGGADLAGALAAMQRDYVRLSRERETFVDWLD